MSEHTHPCLPSLVQNRTSVPSQPAGKFHPVNLSQLTSIADDLDFQASDDADIHSIPSPWSRPLQFMAAIQDKNSKARQGLIGQYRGFLAVLALSKYLNLPIRAQLIDLEDEEIKQAKLGRALNTLKPDENQSILDSTVGNPWLKPYIFYYKFKNKEHVIGMTCPATLVTPAPYLDDVLRQQIPWIQDNHFIDPVNALRQSSRERSVLVKWLEELGGSLLGNKQAITTVRKELKSFATSLKFGQLPQLEVRLAENGAFGVPLEPFPLEQLNPMELSEGSSISLQSNVEIVPSDSLTPKRPIYVINKQDLPAKLGHPLGEIIVCGTVSMKTFNPETHKQDNAFFMESDDFFGDELFYIDGENLLPGTWITSKLDIYDSLNQKNNRKQGAKTILLPLNPLLKSYFTSTDLEKRTTLSFVGQGNTRTVKVSLKLPISGFDENRPVVYEVSKEFPIKPENSLEGAIPVIAMWPNVPVGTWKQYFLFTDASENVETAFTLQQPTEEAKSFFRQMGQLKYQYWECTQHPNILEAVNDSGHCLGLLPLKIPQVQRKDTAEWTVGVDFGTSFTNIAVRRGGGTPEWLDLQTHLLSITEAPALIRDRAYREMFIPETFVKDDEEQLPMATLLTTMGWTEPSETSIPTPPQEARTFVPRLDKFNFNFEHLKSNIKWDQIRFQEPFLRHLQRFVAAQATLEGITDITWVISYPSAFSSSEEDQYFTIWEKTLRDMDLQIKGAITNQRHHCDLKTHQTESIAFAEYYRNVCAGVEDNLANTICVDIGGGTSDIAVFRDSNIIYQTSVSYAGRDIYHRILQLYLSSIGDIFGLSDRDAKSLQEVLSGNRRGRSVQKNFNSALDNYLRAQAQTILEGGYTVNANKKKNKEFRTLLVFAFGGLYHYLGLIQKHLASGEDVCTASIFTGGNGSRFMDWLTPTGKYTSRAEINKVLLGVMQMAAELPPNPKLDPIQRTDNPKAEVCTGLIIQQESVLERVEQSNPLLGEVCEVNGQEFMASDLLELPEELDKVTSFTIKTTSELEGYIRNFNQIIIQKKIRSIQTLPETQTKGEQVLANDLRQVLQQVVKDACQQKLGAKEDFELESAFLLQLKCFVDVLASRLARNNGGK